MLGRYGSHCHDTCFAFDDPCAGAGEAIIDRVRLHRRQVCGEVAHTVIMIGHPHPPVFARDRVPFVDGVVGVLFGEASRDRTQPARRLTPGMHQHGGLIGGTPADADDTVIGGNDAPRGRDDLGVGEADLTQAEGEMGVGVGGGEFVGVAHAPLHGLLTQDEGAGELSPDRAIRELCLRMIVHEAPRTQGREVVGGCLIDRLSEQRDLGGLFRAHALFAGPQAGHDRVQCDRPRPRHHRRHTRHTPATRRRCRPRR